ncbi:MAG: cytochrome c family protein, partial [Acidobacteria bacterium]|nr:cytochrome c family protein [Acidobacteriota bacterium]
RCRSWVLVLLPAMLLLAVPRTGAEEHAFLGSKNCRKCHLKEYKSWEETSMAKTFEVLKPGERADEKKAAGLDPQKDYTKDASCVKCHVTGYGKKGGFVDIETTPELAGVGCESCHGAGGTYVQDQYMSLKNKEYKKADIVAVGLVDKVSK